MWQTLPNCNVATTYDSGAFPPVHALLQLVEQHRTSERNTAYNTSYTLLRRILRLISCTVCISTEEKKKRSATDSERLGCRRWKLWDRAVEWYVLRERSRDAGMDAWSNPIEDEKCGLPVAHISTLVAIEKKWQLNLTDVSLALCD